MSFRLQSAVIGLVACLIVGAASPLLAAGPHALCASRSHACGAAQLVKCCCPDGAHRAADGAPAPARVEIARAAATGPTAIVIDAPVHHTHSRDAIRHTRPYLAALDRQSLFGSFLI